jgi:hypothetical protein
MRNSLLRRNRVMWNWRRVRYRHGRWRETLPRRQRRPQRRRQANRRRRNIFHRLCFLDFFNAFRNRRFGLHRGFRRRLRVHRLLRWSTFFCARNFACGGRGISVGFAGHASADLQSHVVVERAGMRFFVANAQLRQRLKNYVRLYFELAGQLINANFTHTINVPPPQKCGHGFSRKFCFSLYGIRCGGRRFRVLYRIRFVF